MAIDDPVFVETLRLLAMIPQAAKGEDFGDGLRRLDLRCGSNPSLADLLISVSRRLDEVGKPDRQNDFSGLSRRALLGTLSDQVTDRLPGLFAATPTDIRDVLRSLSTSKGFAGLARGFFTRLLGDVLGYWLDRVASTRVGPGQRFADAAARNAFDAALDLHAFETTRIIREFAGGWYGATLHREGSITSQRAAAFGAVSFRKIVEELRVRSNA
jgi:hypothetical protein